MSDKIKHEVIEFAHAWDRAMVGNDATLIGQFMADDWIIIGSDGAITNKTNFLSLVKSGALTHNVMESEDFNVRIYGDTAVVVAKGVSGGEFQGRPFREVERSTCVFVKQSNKWVCVLTHLSQIGGKDR